MANVDVQPADFRHPNDNHNPKEQSHPSRENVPLFTSMVRLFTKGQPRPKRTIAAIVHKLLSRTQKNNRTIVAKTYHFTIMTRRLRYGAPNRLAVCEVTSKHQDGCIRARKSLPLRRGQAKSTPWATIYPPHPAPSDPTPRATCGPIFKDSPLIPCLLPKG